MRDLAAVRSGRDPKEAQAALATLANVAQGSGLLMPHILQAVRAMATLGEISHTLRGVWGSFDRVGA
jgi:methylmalonyl-CoA mutase N-terminal domain/subunit